MKEKLQTYGKSMLVPISLVAIGGLLLGIGGALTSEVTVKSLGIEWSRYSHSIFFNAFTVMKGLGDVIFKNLGILYAVGVAFSLAKKERGWAAFSAMVAYLSMLTTLSILLKIHGFSPDSTSINSFISQGMSSIEATKASALFTTELGYFTYRTGVFGGLAIGFSIASVHARFYNTKLPMALAFFSGTRTVPILSLLAGGVTGIFFYLFWPFIGGLLSNFAGFVHSAGLLGTFVYRAANEILIPFGMHPLLSLPIRWTQLGGTAVVDGVIVSGTSAIQMAQLASSESGKLLVRAFMGGNAIINFAIYPGIALAMYHTTRPENKKKVAALLISVVVSTVMFGITEPILFTFLFIAPWLYFLVFAPLAAIGEVLSEFCQVSIYQGNIKDWIPFILRPEKLNIWPFLWLFPLFFIVSYCLFRTLIVRFNIKTPGREEVSEEDEIRLYTKQDYNEKVKGDTEGETLSDGIIAALGGRENIVEVDNCISRLRIILVDADLMAADAHWKKHLKAMGIVRIGKNGVQIVYGPDVCSIAVDVREQLGMS
nr:PTS transporter subunit EIIC [uncultured Enterobacter sp.]